MCLRSGSNEDIQISFIHLFAKSARLARPMLTNFLSLPTSPYCINHACESIPVSVIVGVSSTLFWKGNFPVTPHIRLLVCWLVFTLYFLKKISCPPFFLINTLFKLAKQWLNIWLKN